MITIDYTQLQTYIDCPRKYRYKYIDKIIKSIYDETSIDISFGQMMHGALERYYKDAGSDVAIEWFADNFVDLKGEAVKTKENGVKLLTAYFNRWSDKSDGLADDKFETLAVEPVDSFMIGDDIKYVVKIDRIVKSLSGIYPMDHKTTKSIKYNYFWQFDPNMQMSGYCKYCEVKYGQCSGAIIDAIECGYRKRVYKGEPAGFHAKFIREVVNRSIEQLVDFEGNVKSWVSRLSKSLNTNDFPKNEKACHDYRGCGFRELCQSCDDESVRESMYVDHNPTSYLKDNNINKETEKGGV